MLTETMKVWSTDLLSKFSQETEIKWKVSRLY